MTTTGRRLAVLCLALCGSLALAAEPTEIEAVGEAAIVGDKAQARDKAIEDALRRAVEQACGTLVAAETQVRDNQLVSDRILTRAKGYVGGYSVLSEKEEKGVVRVTVKAKVGTDRLADDLAAIGLTLARKGMPSILVLIGEQAVDDKSPKRWWSRGDGGAEVISLQRGVVEGELLTAWSPDGFSFVDHEILGGELTKQGALAEKVLDKDLFKFGGLVRADVVIHGDVTVLPTEVEVAGVKKSGCEATVKLFASETGSGNRLATLAADDRLLHPLPSKCGVDLLKRLMKQHGPEFKGLLLKKWQDQLAGGGTVVLEVKGADFQAMKQLKANLTSLVRGVKNVGNLKMAAGSGRLDVQGELSAEALGEALDGKKLNKRTIQVTGVTASTLSIELAK